MGTLSSIEITEDEKRDELLKQKRKLLSLLGTTNKVYKDPVLADPITKEGIRITSDGGTSFKLQSSTATYRGSADTWLDLLEPVAVVAGDGGTTTPTSSSSTAFLKAAFKQATPFIPPNLRGPISSLLSSVSSDFADIEYVPMRDLFTN